MAYHQTRSILSMFLICSEVWNNVSCQKAASKGVGLERTR